MENMHALVWRGKGKFELLEIAKPTIADPKDAIVRVTRSAICSSDLHIIAGTVPRAKEDTVLGHELVGVVEQVGAEVRGFKAGDRVSVNVETFCGECFYCKRGYVNNCEKGGWELGCRIDGAQAEYVRVPYADNGLTAIPDGISDEDALFVGDVLATGYWAAEIASIHVADTLLVLGAGPTGLCTMMSARLYSPVKIIAADVNASRLALAKERGLCDVTLDPTQVDVEAEVKRLTSGRGADIVFEVAGAKDTFELAWRAARPSGTVVVVALYPEAQKLPLHIMYGKNLTFKTGGVHASRSEEILALIGAGKLDTSLMITHRTPLNDILEGYDTFKNQKDGCIKWVITPYDRTRE